MGGPHCILASSYKPIIEGLAQGLSIEKNTVVTAVCEKEAGIELLTNRGSYGAEAVIITVLLGVLKQSSLHFDPPLPLSKQKAIERLGIGLFNIAAFRFPEVFWPSDSQAFSFTSFDEESISLFINFYSLTQQPILLGYSGGERSRHLEQYSDQELQLKTMTTLRHHFGQKIPEPEAYFFARWSQDPFSLGSYSYLPVGSSEKDREALAEPVSSRLFFAGEATHRNHPASTHGAYWSGVREAERIIKVLNPTA